jgi:hypothetical protein
MNTEMILTGIAYGFVASIIIGIIKRKAKRSVRIHRELFETMKEIELFVERKKLENKRYLWIGNGVNDIEFHFVTEYTENGEKRKNKTVQKAKYQLIWCE